MIAFSKLPRSGIGNKLFVWAQGVVFSHVNNCGHFTAGWVKIHLGPVLRGEKSLRFYSGYVPLNRIFRDLIGGTIHSIFSKKVFLFQEDCSNIGNNNAVYLFEKIPHSENYFIALREYQELIKERMYSYFDNKILSKVASYDPPIIGLHIRLGDFKVGGLTTPTSYYLQTINRIRDLAGQDVAVTIFTDGHPSEIQEILDLPNVKLACDDKDLVHLLLLSRSKIIVMTSNSTFSQWAGFLSNSLLIYDKNVINSRLRPDGLPFEGSIDEVTSKDILQSLLSDVDLKN